MQVLRLTVSAVEYGNLNAISDGASAANLAIAAIRSAALNVKINRKGLRNPQAADGLMADIRGIEEEIAVFEQRITRILEQRAQF